MRPTPTTLFLLAAATLAGCKEEKKEAAQPAADTLAPARTAALERVAALPNMPRTVQFRGVQAYPQAASQRIAVCGLVSAFADDATIFVPFVAVAARANDPQATPPRFDIDVHVGTTTTEAGRVYAMLVANCWDRGGPAPGRPPALPPLPEPLPAPRDAAPPAAALPTAAAAPAAQAAPATPADGSVTLRQSANIHADPHGPTVRTAAGGASLHVFARAPGGWYQVGDTSPWGWVHESMLSR